MIFFKENKVAWHRFAVLPLIMIYLEIMLRLIAGIRLWTLGLVAAILIGAGVGLLLSVLTVCFGARVNRILMIALSSVVSLWYCVQLVYHSIFSSFMILYSLFAGGNQIMQDSAMVHSALASILRGWWIILLVLVLPIVAAVLYTKYFEMEKCARRAYLWRGGVGAALCVMALVFCNVVPSLREVAQDTLHKEKAVQSFGLPGAEVKDITTCLFGVSGGDIASVAPIDIPVKDDTEYLPQVEEIDFAALAQGESDKDIASLHSFFANEVPSKQNEYTGMFEGYNLIQITAEGFSPYAIDKELTPTLYKMQNEGFRFTNFYTPIWEVSTSDGEYAATMGLIPKSGAWSYYQSGQDRVLMPYSMPQQFLNSGVETVRAYHNHTYSYYRRDVSHPNLGFAYRGIGNGLEQKMNGKLWPSSDLDMIEATVEDYLDGTTPFMIYYMTVSGHMEYSFDGNSMSLRNKKLVSHLPYSDTVKAYYACNIELDKAMESLLTHLEKAGVADKTVIVITPDHYPYGLEDKEASDVYHYFDEIAGHDVEETFELYKSSLIIYCPSMQPTTVEKYCSAVDILPTLNNLFGFPYDSRLLMGRDILSDSEPLVVFMDRSFITSKGRYNAASRTFERFEGVELEDEESYVKNVKAIVSNKFKVSTLILDNDYYALVTGRKHLYSK